MNVICSGCGKTVENSGFTFCPYCGAKLPDPAEKATDGKAEAWIRKALGEQSYPKRREILRKGLEECPDSREIAWELIFIGEEEPEKKKAVSFSVIKCYVLDIYMDPGSHKEQEKDRMRSRLFDDPEIARCCALFENPERKLQEYIQRLCHEYLVIFLAGNNRIMGNWFGFRNERNKDKKLAEPVSMMIRRIMADKKLLPEQKDLLRKEMIRAFAAETGGKTDLLEGL